MKNRILAVLTVTMVITLLCGCAANNNTVEVFAENAIESVEPTTEPTTEEETQEVTQETVETEITQEVTEEITEETPEAITEPEAPTFTYTDMSSTMYSTQSVNVRSLPDTTGEKLGSLSLNQEVNVTGQCNETNWYRIEYNSNTAYVSNKYLGDSKVEVKVEQPVSNDAPASTSTTTTNTASNTCPYPLYTIQYDNRGYPYFYKTPRSEGHDSENNACMDTLFNYASDSYGVTGEFVGHYDEGYIYVWTLCPAGRHLTQDDLTNWDIPH